MRNQLLTAFILASCSLFAQQIGAWGDLYSYNRVNDIVRLPNEVYLCAAGRAMYTFDYPNREVAKFSKANGLNDVDVASIERDPVSGRVVVGYANANIDILDGERIINVSDIFDASKYAGLKRINEIYIRDGIAYLATGFGVVELDIEREIILDTWILGDNNTELEVFDLVFHDGVDSVYAATEDGLYRASVNDPLFFYESWSKDERIQEPLSGMVDIVNNVLFTGVRFVQQDSLLMHSPGLGWINAPDPSLGEIQFLQAKGDKLHVCFAFSSEIRGDNGAIEDIVTGGFGGNAGFSPRCFEIGANENWFIGDNNQGLIFVDNPNFVQRAKPLSPESNNVYSVYDGNTGLYISTGNVNGVWAPTFNFQGFYQLNDEKWTTFGVGATDTAHDVLQVLEDPLDPTRFFVAAMGTGILEYRNGTLFETWDVASTNGVLTNTGNNQNDLRTGGMVFDADGVLWVTTSEAPNTLTSYDRDGNWQAWPIGTFSGRGAKNIRVLENGDIWIQGRNDGIYAVRIENGQVSTQHLSTGQGNGDLSSSFIHDFEEDRDGEIWIGTGEGVMVHYAPNNLFEPGRNYDAQSILILEDGVYQRLLGSEGVLAVEVDGANNKWFGTETGGLFYTSDDGIDEIYHFTKENSPLPSNRIVDVEVEDETGVVYIATDLGVVTFNGTATGGLDQMDEISVYPNPVRPGYEGPIAIRGLVTDAQVKITDVSGNLVFETRANGGQAIWMGTDLDGRRVATGVYLAYITDDLGENTAVVKILLVNGNG